MTLRAAVLATFSAAALVLPLSGGTAQDLLDPDATAQGDVSVTIYNSGVALVQDVRQLNIASGRSTISFPDVSAQIRPETLSFAADGTGIVEQNFDFDLLTPAKLMEKAIGQTVTLVRDESRVFRPDGIDPTNHLWLQMDDIADPIDGMIAPSQTHVAQLVEFAERWDRAGPLVVHCYAGISRSTAAAFIAACALAPARDEAELAQRIRKASPTASPNPRLVALADAYLERRGRMMDAVAQMGPAVAAYEAEPFELRWD